MSSERFDRAVAAADEVYGSHLKVTGDETVGEMRIKAMQAALNAASEVLWGAVPPASPEPEEVGKWTYGQVNIERYRQHRSETLDLLQRAEVAHQREIESYPGPDATLRAASAVAEIAAQRVAQRIIDAIDDAPEPSVVWTDEQRALYRSGVNHAVRIAGVYKDILTRNFTRYRTPDDAPTGEALAKRDEILSGIQEDLNIKEGVKFAHVSDGELARVLKGHRRVRYARGGYACICGQGVRSNSHHALADHQAEVLSGLGWTKVRS